MVTAIVADQGRSQIIARLAISLSKKRKTLVMTDRVEHAEILASMIPGSLLVHGKLPAKEKKKEDGRPGNTEGRGGNKGSSWGRIGLFSVVVPDVGIANLRANTPTPSRWSGNSSIAWEN